MSLPKIKINYTTGALGRVASSPDGVFGLLTTGVAVPSTFALQTSYVLRSLDDAKDDLGINAENNPGLYKVLKEFYDVAGAGTELWLRAFSDASTMTDMLDLDVDENVKTLLNDANGRLRGIFVHRTPPGSYSETTTGGLDADVFTAISNATLVSNYCAETMKAPVFVIVSGLYYTGTALTDLTIRTDNTVAVMVGDTVSGDGCAIGLLAGRLAAMPVQRNAGRVKDGAIHSAGYAFIGSTKVENADVESIHDKGYITLRQHVGRTGYFFTDDPLATLPTDDYNGIAVRRVIDKAYRLAYETMTAELLDEVSVNDQGQVSVSYAKSIENKVENAIINSMTVNGELGNDPADQNDTGVECLVDPTLNVLATGKIVVSLRIKPFGYAKYIEVNLGFKIITQ